MDKRRKYEKENGKTELSPVRRVVGRGEKENIQKGTSVVTSNVS